MMHSRLGDQTYSAFIQATYSCENRHFAFFLSQIEKETRAIEKKARCRLSQLKVARVNAALVPFSLSNCGSPDLFLTAKYAAFVFFLFFTFHTALSNKKKIKMISPM